MLILLEDNAVDVDSVHVCLRSDGPVRANEVMAAHLRCPVLLRTVHVPVFNLSQLVPQLVNPLLVLFALNLRELKFALFLNQRRSLVRNVSLHVILIFHQHVDFLLALFYEGFLLCYLLFVDLHLLLVGLLHGKLPALVNQESDVLLGEVPQLRGQFLDCSVILLFLNDQSRHS